MAHPLHSILHKLETLGRLTKWSIKLREFDVLFVPHSAIKAQALADFVAKFTGHNQTVEMAEGVQI